MEYRNVRDLELADRTVLLRADLNVPLDGDGDIRNDQRIRAALPTIEHLLDAGSPIVLMSHLGRPGGSRDDTLSLRPVAERLEELLGNRAAVRLVEDFAGDGGRDASDGIEPGVIMLLENLRFHGGERADDEKFAATLALLGDAYVNDAFGACHRRHASVHALPKQFGEEERAVGLLVERELHAIDALLGEPTRPLVAVMGGAKVADKLGVVERLLDVADEVLLGGAMAYTFLAAEGRDVGDSPIEKERLKDAAGVLSRAEGRLFLPTDHRTRAADGNGDPSVEHGNITDGRVGLDVGPETARTFAQRVSGAGSVIWNGPLGRFEEAPFAEGTRHLVEALCAADARTLVGGGETGEAIERFGDLASIDHVSTGGGAFLAYLEHGSLPALEVIPATRAQARP